MKRALLICCFAILTSFLSAQKIYFVYLQTETGEPFFIRMNEKLYSSTASGYLILSRLKDSTYNFKLGFPGKDINLDFTTSISKKDHGYLIKNLGEKGWGLFDLQSLSLQMSSSNAKTNTQFNNNSNSQVNAFTNLLSQAADDPSLKLTPVFVKEEGKKSEIIKTVEKEEKKPDVIDAVVKEDKKTGTNTQSINKPEENKLEVATTNDQKNQTDEKKPAIQKEEVYKKSRVIKLSDATSTEGFESVFVDDLQNGSKDTIRIFIPDNKEMVIKENVNPETKKEDKKFLDISSDTSQKINNAEPDLKNSNADKNKTVTAEIKYTCKSVADNDDFLKLRRKMAAKTNDNGMIDEAKKYFKTKCFTTEQIKNLSSMFLSNAGKYNFFDAAYNYVSDSEHFSSLQSELKDDYYINRFKAMLR